MVKPRNRKSERGIVLIEMAIVLQLLLLLTFAVIEYGWIFTKSGEIVNAARNGARIGVTIDATNSDIQNAVAALMTQAGLGDSGYAVDISPSDVTLLNAGDTLTVTVTVNYDDNIELTDFPFIPVPETLEAAISMAREGI